MNSDPASSGKQATWTCSTWLKAKRETRRKSEHDKDGQQQNTPLLTRELSQSPRASSSSVNTQMQGIETA